MTTQAVVRALEKIQYTIRGIPPNVDEALRQEAMRRNISFNQLIVEELTSISGVSGRTYRSLAGIAGQWEEDAEFDKVLEEQRKIDVSLWQ